jgi:dienelactone hydrolase
MRIIKNIIVEGEHDKPVVTDVFYKETNQPKRIIIFCHGYKGFKDWGAWNLMAAVFAKAGFFFIKFNFSHNGGTPEQPIDFPDLEAFGNNNYTKELDDLASVINWVSNHSGFKNEVKLSDISLIGHSRGGGIVLLKTNEDARIKKVITFAGVCDFEKRTATIGDLEQWKNQGVKYVLNGRTKQKIPYLIIHGNNDTSVLIDEAESLKKWNSKSEFKIIDNANHVFNTSHPWKENHLSEELETTIKNCIEFLK